MSIRSDIFSVAFIADIHFGSLSSEELYNELKKNFLDKICNKKIDMVVFGGDLFHSIITMNYSTSHYVLLFMKEVLEVCKANNIKYIRLIQGTMSHDNNQLNNFAIYENRTDIDFKIFRTVGTEELAEGIKILYVPEEYMSIPEEYYSEYLDETKGKQYDFIFGHGMFRDVAFIAKKQESEVTMSKAPIFDSKVFESVCKGPIYFGHIHIKTNVRHNIFYPGSFSRFKHGEEADKGWYLCIYNKDTSDYKHEFIVNDMAKTYVTILVNLTDKSEAIDIINIVKMGLKQNDYIKLKIVINENVDSSYILARVNEEFSNNKRVKLDVKNNFEFKQEIEEDKLVQKIYDKYNFLFNEGLSHEDKIQKFIKVKKDKVVPIDIIKKMLKII